MTREQILNDDAWKFVLSLTPDERYRLLFISAKQSLEKAYNVSVRKISIMQAHMVPPHWVATSVVDMTTRNVYVAALEPNQQTQHSTKT